MGDPFENLRHEVMRKEYVHTDLDALYQSIKEQFIGDVCSECLYYRQNICGSAAKVEVRTKTQLMPSDEDKVTLRCQSFLIPSRENKFKLSAYLLGIKSKRE